MAGVVGRVGGWWKAAAGCAICASLVAGVIEDARHWVWDRTVGFVFPAQASFDTCVARHMAEVTRPHGSPAFHVLVTVPASDDDRSQFSLIVRSLTRAYGEDATAPVQVEALDCAGMQPTGGIVAQGLEVARNRALALIEGTGADVVVWGEVLVPGEALELRFTARETIESRADYGADSIVLAPDFGTDLGALVASKALTSVRGLASGDSGVGLRRAELAVAITAPLIAALPPDIDPQSQADLYYAHGMALGIEADVTQDMATFAQSRAMFQRALALFDPKRRPREWIGVRANLAMNATYTAGELETGARLAQLAGAAEDLARLAGTDEVAVGPDLIRALRLSQADALLRQAPMLPAPEASARIRAAMDLLSRNLAELDRNADPLDWAQAQVGIGVAAEFLARATPKDEAARALADGATAISAGIEVLAQAGQPLDHANALVFLGSNLKAQAGLAEGAARIALLERARDSFAQARDGIPREDNPLMWALAQAGLGRALHVLGSERPDATAAAVDLAAARAALLAAQKVMPAKSYPFDWADLETNLALVAETCAQNPACAPRAEALGRARAHAEAAATVFRDGGHTQNAAYADELTARLQAELDN